MKVYLVVLVFAITIYWFKDPLIDLANNYFNDSNAPYQVNVPQTRMDKINRLDRSTKEMSRFIKPTVTPKVKIDKEELKKRLTPLEYHITQEKGTERPGTGKYLKVNENGMYTCVVCNEELFSTEHQYDSGCGWPAFHSLKNISKVTLTTDSSHNQLRTEVSCSNCGAHLGHVFDDGPTNTKTRFCINSVSLKFKKDGNNNNE